MANEISFSVAYNGDAIDNLGAGAQVVTQGTSAPGAGNLEIRIGDPAVSPWTKAQLRRAFETIWRFLDNPQNGNGVPL